MQTIVLEEYIHTPKVNIQVHLVSFTVHGPKHALCKHIDRVTKIQNKDIEASTFCAYCVCPLPLWNHK